jgi:hypothetical protein
MTQYALPRILLSLACLIAACGPGDPDAVHGAAPALEVDVACHQEEGAATLRDVAGTAIGRVSFSSDCDHTLVTISAQLPIEQGGTRARESRVASSE